MHNKHHQLDQKLWKLFDLMMFAIKLFANLKTKLLFSFLNSVAYKQKKFFWEHFMIIFFRRVRIIGNHYWHQSPPPRTSARSPPVGQTLGSDDLPEGRSLVTERPLQKKNIDTSVRSTVRRGAQWLGVLGGELVQTLWCEAGAQN